MMFQCWEIPHSVRDDSVRRINQGSEYGIKIEQKFSFRPNHVMCSIVLPTGVSDLPKESLSNQPQEIDLPNQAQKKSPGISGGL